MPTAIALQVEPDKHSPDFQYLSAEFAKVADGVNPLALLDLYNAHQGINQPAARSAFNAAMLRTQIKLLNEICSSKEKPINTPEALLIASYYLWAGYDLTTSFEFSIARSIQLLTDHAKDVTDPRITGAIDLLQSLVHKKPGDKKDYEQHVIRAVCFAPYFGKPDDFQSFLHRWQKDIAAADSEFYGQMRNLYELVLKSELNTLLSTAGLPRTIRTRANKNIEQLRTAFKTHVKAAVKRRGKGTQGKRLVKLTDAQILEMAATIDQRNYRELAEFFKERIKDRAAMILLNRARIKSGLKPVAKDIIDRDWQAIAPHFAPEEWQNMLSHYGVDAQDPVNWDLLRRMLQLAERLRTEKAQHLGAGSQKLDVTAIKMAAFFMYRGFTRHKNTATTQPTAAESLAVSAAMLRQSAVQPADPVVQRAHELIMQAAATSSTDDKAHHAVRMLFNADFYTNGEPTAFAKQLDAWCWQSGARLNLKAEKAAIKARADLCEAQFRVLPTQVQQFIGDVHRGKIRAARFKAGNNQRDPNAGARMKKLKSGKQVIDSARAKKLVAKRAAAATVNPPARPSDQAVLAATGSASPDELTEE